MASCTLCASLSNVIRSETRFTTKDDAQSHAAQHLSQMKQFDEKVCSSLDQVFDRCFPNFIVTPLRKQKRIVVKKEGRQSVLEGCRTVFKGRISEASPSVNCQKCGTKIKLYDGKSRGLRFELAINHASIHLGIDLFECRQCGCSFSNKKALSSHLRTTRGLRCLSEYFTDNSGDYIDKITNSIQQCFTEVNVNGPTVVKARMISLKNESNVRSKTKGSKLAVERHIFCYQLMRQLDSDDGKIQCRLCLQRIYIKQKSGYKAQSALEHALMHLKKPVFRCKVCSTVHHSRGTMILHLKSVHALPLSNNHDSLADEFHAEILDMLRKCYAEKAGS